MKNTPILIAWLFIAAALVVWLTRSPEDPPDPSRATTSKEMPSVSRDSRPMSEPRGADKGKRSFPFEPKSEKLAALQIPAELAGQLKALHDAGPEADGRGDRIISIARQWAALDPQGALAWAFTLELGMNRAVAAQVLRIWVADDPVGALKTLDSLKSINPELHRDGERRVFSHWAALDPRAAWETAGAVANPQSRSEIEGNILLQWSQTEPDVVAGILDGVIATPGAAEEMSTVFEATAGTLADGNPSAASKWAASLPEGAARTSAVSGLVGNWLLQDFPSASNWLGSLDPGEARDAGIIKLVMTTRNREPQVAMEWAALTSDPALRTRLVTNASLSWWTLDPEAARRAVDDSRVLNQEEKNSIRESFEQMRN